MDLGTALAQAGALKQKNMTTVADIYAFNGGLNLMDPPNIVKGGMLLGCLNYEPGVRGGYRRWDGYERFDGHLSPTNTAYMSLKITPGLSPAIGASVTESGSGASGQLSYIDTVNNVYVVTAFTTEFVGNGSTLTISGGGGGTTVTIGPAFLDSGTTTALSVSYQNANFMYLQAMIGPVGGAACSGPVLFAAPFLNATYAVRNNSAGTAATFWKATSTGWQQVSLGIKVRFSTGVYSDGDMDAPLEGTVVTGSTSGATATIQRINALSGTWGTDAAGFFIVSAITGTFTANETLKIAGTVAMTYLSHANQVLQPNGKYFYRVTNFDAVQNPLTGYRMYWVNGVDFGIEYDGVANVFVQIETGNSPDTPDRLENHADYLFYSFPGGSIQNSGYQLPINWNPVFGASERQVGDTVTFMREDISSTLVIGTRKQIWMLTGISLEQFQISTYSKATGALANTDEAPGQMIFMEDRGFTTVAASQQYGDFEAQSLSDLILSLIPNLINNDTAIGAVTTRYKNLYRLMFASGTVLCLGVNAQGDSGGWTTGSVGITPNGFYGGFLTNAEGVQQEVSYMCGANGYVYQMDTGVSFDGQNLQHFLRMAYYSSKSPDTFKRYRRVSVDLAPEGPCSLLMSVDYDFGNRTGQVNQPLDFTGKGGFWDVALWDQFNWDGAQYTQAVMKLEGEGYNIGLFFAGNSNTDAAITIYDASLQWSPRIINRNTGSQ